MPHHLQQLLLLLQHAPGFLEEGIVSRLEPGRKGRSRREEKEVMGRIVERKWGRKGRSSGEEKKEEEESSGDETGRKGKKGR